MDTPQANGLFDTLAEVLRLQDEKARRVFSGAACEQWLNAEFRHALNWCHPTLLRPGIYAVNECKKRDIVLFSNTHSPEDQWRAEHVVEIKLVYASYSRSKIRERMFDLRSQMCNDWRKDEYSGTQRSGIVLAVWDEWRKQYAGFGTFVEAAELELQFAFDSARFGDQANQRLQTLLPPKQLTFPYGVRETGIAGGYVELVPRDVSLDVHTSTPTTVRHLDDKGIWFTNSEVMLKLHAPQMKPGIEEN